MWFGKIKKHIKDIYNALTKNATEVALNDFANKWKDNWDKLTAFYEFPVNIRKIIYTTNLIENTPKTSSLSQQMRLFMKSAFLALREATKNGLCLFTIGD